MDIKRLRELSGLNEAKATQSQLISHVVKVMNQKLKMPIISADLVQPGAVVVRTRLDNFSLDPKMAAVLGKDKFFVAVTVSSKEAIFRFESELKEGLNEAANPQVALAIASDLVDIFKASKGNRDKIRKSTLTIFQELDTREIAAVRTFIADLADELENAEE